MRFIVIIVIFVIIAFVKSQPGPKICSNCPNERSCISTECGFCAWCRNTSRCYNWSPCNGNNTDPSCPNDLVHPSMSCEEAHTMGIILGSIIGGVALLLIIFYFIHRFRYEIRDKYYSIKEHYISL